MNASELTPERGLIFRITHIDNVRWLLANGIHCRNSPTKDPDFREIGNRDLIAKRADRTVPVAPRGTLSDYVPFYFTPWSPMLMNITTGHNGMMRTPARDIAVLVAGVATLHAAGIRFLLTDRHAYLQTATFTPGVRGLQHVDWKLLQSRDFKRDDADPDKFDRYQAEALVHGHVPASALSTVVVHDDRQRRRIEAELLRLRLDVRLAADASYYL